MAVRIEQICQRSFVLRHRFRQVHRLRGRGSLVEQRRIGDLQSCQIGDHRLKIEERFQPALRDLGLVGCVRRVPTGILQHVPLDHRRRDAVGVAHAEVGAEDLVLRGEQTQRFQRLQLASGRGGA